MSDSSSLESPPGEEQPGHGSRMAAISRRIVALLKEHYGKGPMRARTYHVEDLVVVLLYGGYTPVEKTLLEDGRSKAVMDQRAAFQEVMRPRFKQVIEQEMDRRVQAFMSTNHHDPNINAELFVLAPEGSDRPR